jgi:hypothetical protein
LTKVQVILIAEIIRVFSAIVKETKIFEFHKPGTDPNKNPPALGVLLLVDSIRMKCR